MLPENILRMAPCLRAGPLAQSGTRFVLASQNLGDSRWASVVRAWVLAHFFHEQEKIFASKDDPTVAFVKTINEMSLALEQLHNSPLTKLTDFSHRYETTSASDDVEAVTGQHYGTLFRAFSRTSFDEATNLLRIRLERNNVSINGLGSKRVLDAGCGGGRYTVAWKMLGAKEAVGLDMSAVGLENARERVREADITGVEFVEGNVLNIPFPDNSFDISFSNGVVHHSKDWETGMQELVRVLKPGGLGWVYVIEDPGGLFWDMVEILRVIMKDEHKGRAQHALHALGMSANRIFYMLDHVLVPINVRLKPEEVEKCLREAGAKNIRRLERGVDFDRVEAIHRKDPYCHEKFGVGENRYVFSK